MGREIVVPEQGGAVAKADDVQMPGLLRLAIEKGVDVAVLERLVALNAQVQDRNARAAFIEALARFQEQCPPILKTRENSQFSVTRAGVKQTSRYAPLEEIQRVARPVAAALGLVWTWDTKVDDTLMHVTCRVLHQDGHSESASVSLPFASNAGSSAQQKYGSAQTYGMRYSLVAALGITTADDDDDGNDPTAPVSPQQVEQMSAKIDAVGADYDKFLRFMGVEVMDQILASDFDRAMRALDAKARK